MFSISHIIGYIITPTIISNMFNFNGNSLDLIGEFGIVFLMFTISLEMSFSKLHQIKELIFVNGFMQVALCSLCIFLLSFYAFSIEATSSLIIDFSLSSTAIGKYLPSVPPNCIYLCLPITFNCANNISTLLDLSSLDILNTANAHFCH